MKDIERIINKVNAYIVMDDMALTDENKEMYHV